jgi:formiminotetrahydrofolate cyclodeaminase
MTNITVDDWLRQLANRQPTPGGGAAAALAAATAAALVGMVSTYTTGQKWQDVEAHMQDINGQAAELRNQALALMQADAEAFAQVGAAYQLPKTTETEKSIRKAAIQQALVLAAQPPTVTARVTSNIVQLCTELAPIGNPNVISDIAVAASYAKAALESAIVNIEINEQSITDPAVKQHLHTEIAAATSAIKDADAVVQATRKRMQKA